MGCAHSAEDELDAGGVPHDSGAAPAATLELLSESSLALQFGEDLLDITSLGFGPGLGGAAKQVFGKTGH